MSGLDLILVSLGGGINSLARWVAWGGRRKMVRRDISSRYFPTQNLGSVFYRFFAVFLDFDWTERFGHPFNTFVLTGVLAGYTTFSAMALDTTKLIQGQKTFLALMYLFGTIALAFVAAFFGAALASRML
ncbi:MAG: CrcB family protein [Nitrospirales bacterium]